jgi:crossover junction endodeoxyribonuclease RuvC
MPPDAKPVASVLGFDPGFGRLGVALVRREKGKEVLSYSACFTTKSGPFDARMQELGQRVEELMEAERPDAVALERVFMAKNKKTAMEVSEIRGMLRYLAGKMDLPVFEYGPSEVKVAVTGYGASDKKAVEAMVRRLIAVPPGSRLDDEMDAVAIALTCLSSMRYPQR